MIKTILVDDEPRGLNTLKKLLQEYCPDLKIIAECIDAETAREKIELLEPQLVFLDISLPGKNSFELLEELDEVNFEIIFVTAHNEFMLKAFRYSAIDYLLKPIDEDLLTDALHRAVKRMSKNDINQKISVLLHHMTQNKAGNMTKLCISSVKGFQVVELKDILYCEASGSYTNFHFVDRSTFCSARSIHEYEDLLSDGDFMRIHKSYLINLSHVKEYIRGEGGTVLLSNNKEIEVSRRKKEMFIMRMKNFNNYP